MSKKVGIMQPYIFPYIGYYQLINAVDEFIIYDNIQYTKKGWINRNNILLNGEKRLFTLPIKKDSDYLDVVDRRLSDTWDKEKKKTLNLIKSTYSKSPYFNNVYPLIEDCFNSEEKNLFRFLYDSLLKVNGYLDIKTKITISSDINIDHDLKSQDKVLELCKSRDADVYINAIGGIELYDKNVFNDNGIDLKFIKTGVIEYNQFKNDFIPWLSIIDVMMFNDKKIITEFLNNYNLI